MKFSWLGELVPVVWWMELNLVFPKVSTKFSSMFWAVHGFGITLVSLCANVQGCCPVLLKDWCGVPGTGTCWPLVVLGLSAELEVFESTFAKGSMGSRVLWWFIVLDSGLPPSGIQAWPLTVAPRLHRSHSTEDKTLRLLVKAKRSSPRPQKKLSKILQYFYEGLWSCCGQCGVSSGLDLALLQLVIAPKVPCCA